MGDKIRRIIGEMKSEIARDKIPFPSNEAEEVAQQLEGEDPCYVCVEIPEGEGNYGYYTAMAIEDVVNKVNKGLPNGFAGHQRPEDLPYEFPEITTHWLAAEIYRAGGKTIAKVYGLVDEAEAKLKRWIRARRIKEVSIYGEPIYKGDGTSDIVGFNLYSIDWTPKGRPGMDTRLVWASEINNGGGKEMDLNEILANLRSKIAKKEVDLKTVVSEIGFTDEQVLQIIASEQLEEAKQNKETAKKAEKLVQALGLDSQEDLDKAIKKAEKMKEVYDADQEENQEQVIDEVVEEKVAGEQAQALAKKMLKVEAGADKKIIAAEIDKILEDEVFKAVVGNAHIDKPAGKIVAGEMDNGVSNKKRTYSSVKRKRVGI
ncbi:hypothetical protein U472_00435 [Orenia metallireducens]|uniref:Mu-like prophage I protein n=1 Tax=Orenia metallireducens TaxID=1413210 RepID=A0A1C0ADG6_9FIRM|nr:hypothetical protein [Orenia metallireducens]OCL28656.1 hypothetical protein U472_00435 [Orenia metallireducens]